MWDQNIRRIDREEQSEEKKQLSAASRGVSALTGVAQSFTHGGPGMALSAVQAGAQGLGNVAQSIGLSGASVPVFGAVAGAAGVMLAALNYRYGVAVRRAQLDEKTNALGLYGGGGWGGGGYTPEEAVGLMGGFGQGAGYSTALKDTDVLGLNRTGTGIGAMASYAGTSAAGMGGEGRPNVGSLIATAQNSKLRGSKVDDYLQRITAAVTQLGESGLTLNLANTERFMRQLANTGAFQGAGMAQTRLLSGITGAISGARSSLLSPYSGVAQMALQAWAMQQPGGFEALEGMEPEQAKDIITRSVGPTTAAKAFSSMNITGAQGRAAAGPLGAYSDMKTRSYGAGGLKEAYAAKERRILSMIDKDDAGLFKQAGDAEAIVMAIGKAGSETVAALQDFANKLADSDQNIATAWDEAKDWLRDNLVEPLKKAAEQNK